MSTEGDVEGTVKLIPFFRRKRGPHASLGPQDYESGYKSVDGTDWGLTVPLSAETVESVILSNVEIGLALSPDGQIRVDSEGISDEGLEAISTGLKVATLDELLNSALDLEMVDADDHHSSDLAALAETLRCALRKIENRLKQFGREN